MCSIYGVFTFTWVILLAKDSTHSMYCWWYIVVIMYIYSKPMLPTPGQHAHSSQLSCWSFVLEVISVMSFCWVDYLVWLAYIDAWTLACSVGSWCIAQTAHFGFDVLLSLRPWTRASYRQLSHRCRWLFRRSRTTCVQNFRFWRLKKAEIQCQALR